MGFQGITLLKGNGNFEFRTKSFLNRERFGPESSSALTKTPRVSRGPTQLLIAEIACLHRSRMMLAIFKVFG